MTPAASDRRALILHALAGVAIGAGLGWFWLALTAQRIAGAMAAGAAPW